MTPVNSATMMVLEMFRNRAANLPFADHPYSRLAQTKNTLGKTEWEPNLRAQAIEAMGVWVLSILGNSVTGTMNEILDLMRIAHDLEDATAKKASSEMAGSMPFLEKIVTIFVNDVDVEHVAEMLFEDGLKLASEQNKESPPASPQQPKQPIQNWTAARWKPSMN